MNDHPAKWDQGVQCAYLSDLGLRRANNQDSLAVLLASSREKWRQRGHLFLVADGMGAHAAGELASKLATDVVPLSYDKLVDRPPHEALVAAIQEANSQIHARGAASPEFRGMGTTVSALLLLPHGAITAQVGDSRAYRLRDHCLEQLTFDHSLVWELRAAGQFADEQFAGFIPKNVITRSLGPNPQVDVDLEGPFPVQVGDTFLLCSDGLSGPVEDEELGTILGCLPPDEAVQALVDLANLRGGPDNITAIVVRVTGEEVAQGVPGEAGRVPRRALPRPIGSWLWSLLGAFSLGAIALGALRHYALASLSLVAAIVSGIIAVRRRFGADRGSDQRVNGHPFGKGPYTTRHCHADAPFVERLMTLTHQLRDAAVQEGWVVGWNRFNAHHDRAVAAAMAGDLGEAVREYCRAISFMMAELRSQRSRHPPAELDDDRSIW